MTDGETGSRWSRKSALIDAILADGTNLGLARMTESSRGLAHTRLLWTAEWHIGDETYAGALAAIVDHHHAHPLSHLLGIGRHFVVGRAVPSCGRTRRVGCTLFMLDWLDDADLRRRTNANLNKGEARNALACAVFFNQLGELDDRTFENQRHRASGLNLIVSAIILWNTV